MHSACTELNWIFESHCCTYLECDVKFQATMQRWIMRSTYQSVFYRANYFSCNKCLNQCDEFYPGSCLIWLKIISLDSKEFLSCWFHGFHFLISGLNRKASGWPKHELVHWYPNQMSCYMNLWSIYTMPCNTMKQWLMDSNDCGVCAQTALPWFVLC